jgi:cholesterol oxidase
MSQQHDYDYLVIGSGFGGSVSALRLAEKGYSVAILESGRRFSDSDFAERLSQVRRTIFAPKIGLKGILRVTPFKDVMILSGSGVGGGSLVYAQTLWRAGPGFFDDWRTVCGQAPNLDKYYELAEGMLGVVSQPQRTPADTDIRLIAADLGVADTYGPVPVGVYFGEPGIEHADPYFGGDGPARSGCTSCGLCMLGCRNNAKNTLPKNYLWFAERLGVRIEPERTVTSIRPLGAVDGSGGYAVTSERSGSWLRKLRRTQTARAVVVAAGALGTNQLLAQCKADGALPLISDRLGKLVRTNSESMTAVTVPEDRGWGRSVSITSSMHPTPASHLEAVTYGPGGNAMGLMFTLLTGDGTRLTRPLKLLGQILRHPIRFARVTNPHSWSQRSLITGVMQTTDTSLSLVPKRRILGRRLRLSTRQDPENPTPTFLPVANDIAQRLADRTGGVAQSWLTEALFNIPITAHILGGAVAAPTAEHGVVDNDHRVFGYQNLLICDGAVIPANPGVNPSLTIAAMVERAMATIPAKPDAPRTRTRMASMSLAVAPVRKDVTTSPRGEQQP